MKFKMLVIPILIVSIARGGEDAPNAALKYWTAISLLPNDAGEKASDYFARPKLPEAQKFVADCESALLLLREGAAISRCDWGLDYSKGPMLLMPHLSKLRQLSRVAVLAAQVDFANKNYQAGVDRVMDILALARHAGSDPLLISKLVEIAMAKSAIEVLASHLPDIPASIEIAKRIASLPPSPTLADCMRSERTTFLGWLRRQESAKEITKALGGADAGLVEALRDSKMRSSALEELEKHYLKLEEALSKPAYERPAALAAVEVETAKTASVLVRAVSPALSNVDQSVMAFEVRMAMLNAAIDVVRKGKPLLEQHKDPSSAGAFEYEQTGAGFVLKSKFLDRSKQPVNLPVGQPQQPNAAGAVKPPAPPEPAPDF